MSALSFVERRNLETLFGMSGDYVLNFSDRTFGEFAFEVLGLDIHDEKYTAAGTFKANKPRTFWKLESDHITGTLILALIDYAASLGADQDVDAIALAAKCRQIATRLLASGPSLIPLKKHAKVMSANHLAKQIRRLEASIESDPSLAIGAAKELIESCCKTILAERGKPISGTTDVSTLTRETLRELKLVPEGVPDAVRGADVAKRLLSNLGTIGNGLAELRGNYGTGLRKHGTAIGLSARQARLPLGSAATLSIFLFETHERQSSETCRRVTPCQDTLHKKSLRWKSSILSDRKGVTQYANSPTGHKIPS